jgi:hypothetical protein
LVPVAVIQVGERRQVETESGIRAVGIAAQVQSPEARRWNRFFSNEAAISR